MRIKKRLIVLLTFLLLFSHISFVSAAEPIEEVRSMIEQHYVDEVSNDVLSKRTIQEIMEQLDPYSTYMTKQEYDHFINSINQELVGIGVVIEEHERGIKVTQVIPGGPAEQAGMLAGDIITHVNGKSLQGESVQTAVSNISGEANTFVEITFIEQSTGAAITKAIERKKISLPIVESEMLGGDIGYIRLYSFSFDAAKQIQAAIQSLEGAKGFILDLRDNGGGFVSAAQDVAGLFPTVKDAFQLRERSRTPEIYQAIKQETQFSGPVFILVNEHSASASEMVSAAVKEQGGAVLYGQTTYGKGSMQSMFVLEDASILKLTTGRFYSPKGTNIDGAGVTPHVITAPGEELIEAHRSQLINHYHSYKKLPDLNNVQTDKIFTVEMNAGVNWDNLSEDDVQLFHLGGQEAEVTLEIYNENTLKVKPVNPLLANENYLLVVHPNWKGKKNQTMKQGAYLEIRVAE